MGMRRGAMVAGAVAVLLSVAPAAQQPRYNADQRREIEGISKLLEGVAGGTAAPDDLSLRWVRADLLRAQEPQQYVPFNVTIDASQVNGRNLSIYWRVVDRAAENPSRGPFAYEYFTSAQLPSGRRGEVAFSRSFTVEPGSYDVYVVVKEPTATGRNAAEPKISVLKQEYEVPDLWSGQLATSSILVSDEVAPLAAPLSPQQQIERPYALGNREIVPSLDMTFGKESEVTMFLLIYNAAADSANKPDVTVEYSFYARQGGSEKFFNRTNPQRLHAATLAPEFDLAAGHQLPSGQTVPAAVFPPGDYRLEVKVTDNIASSSVTRDVTFTVAGS